MQVVLQVLLQHCLRVIHFAVRLLLHCVLRPLVSHLEERPFCRLPLIVPQHHLPLKMSQPPPLQQPRPLCPHLIPSRFFTSNRQKLIYRLALRRNLRCVKHLMLCLPLISRTSSQWLEIRSVSRLDALICYSTKFATKMAARMKILQTAKSLSHFGKLTVSVPQTKCCFGCLFAKGERPSRLQILLTLCDTWRSHTPGSIFSRQRLSFKIDTASVSSNK